MHSRVDLSELRLHILAGQRDDSRPPSLDRYHQLDASDIDFLLLHVGFPAALLRRNEDLLRHHPLVSGLEYCVYFANNWFHPFTRCCDSVKLAGDN
jgi:hypothetical protein